MSETIQYDLLRRLAKAERDVKRLQQLANREAVPGIQILPNGDIHAQGGIVLGPGQEKVADPTAIPPPTGLTITPGSSFDTMFLDISWTAPTGYGADQVASYLVQVVKSGGVPLEVTVNSGTQVRVEPLEPSTSYTVNVASVSKTNRNSAFVTGSASTGIDTTRPSDPTGIAVVTFVQSLVITWNENPERDVRDNHGHYRVVVGTNSGLTVRVYDALVSGTTDWVGNLNPSTPYYVAVAAVDSSGNQSNLVSAAGGPFTPDRMGTNGLADNAVTDAKINSLAVSKLTTGVMTATLIVGGILSTAATGQRIELRTANYNQVLYRTGDPAEATGEPGYTLIWQNGSGGARQFVLDMKAPTIFGTPAFGSSPLVRLMGKSADGTIEPSMMIIAAPSFGLITGTQQIGLYNGSTNFFELAQSGEFNNWMVVGSAWYQTIHNGQVTFRVRSAGGFSDARFPALPPNSGDPLMRYNIASGQIFYDSSTRKYKHDIRPWGDDYSLDDIDKLEPISYREKSTETFELKPQRFFGLIAEDVDTVFPELVVRDGNDEPAGLLYDKFVPLLVASVIDLRARVARLEAQ